MTRATWLTDQGEGGEESEVLAGEQEYAAWSGLPGRLLFVHIKENCHHHV